MNPSQHARTFSADELIEEPSLKRLDAAPLLAPLTTLRNCFHVFEHIDEAFFFFNERFELLYLNKAGHEIIKRAYGLQPKPGECLFDSLPVKRRTAFVNIMMDVLKGETADYELEIPERKIWIHCKYFPNYSEKGVINGLYGVVKDITAKKEIGRLEQKAEIIEQDLFQSRLLFERFMQNSPLVAWLTDARGTMQYMNPVYLKTYGFTKNDFGKSIYELFDAQIAIDYHFNNQQVFKTGQAIETIEKGIKANGEEQVLKIYKFPMVINNQNMVGGWAVDITDQVELQERLIKSVERHEYVNEATSDAIYDWDFSTKRLYISTRFQELFGYAEREISIRHRMKHIHPDDLQNFKEVVFSSLRDTSVDRWQVEYRLKNTAGNYQTVLDKAFIIRGDKTVLRVIGALQDVTAQKDLQRRLVQQEMRNKQNLIKSIIEAQEKERRQLSVELHDNVNQMLASCKLMLEVAIESGSNAKMLTEKTYQSIQTVINELRRISHDLNPSAIADVGLVEAIEQLIDKINLAGKTNIQFVPNRVSYGQFLAEEDKIAIFRIVQEQLNNILKHARAKNVIIKLEVANGIISLCIKDDGVGFDLLKCKKGLGLRNIHNRVEYYGGTIHISTGEGKGCEMCISLKTLVRPCSLQQLKIA